MLNQVNTVFAVRTWCSVKIYLAYYSGTLMFKTRVHFFEALCQGHNKVHAIGHQMDGRRSEGWNQISEGWDQGLEGWKQGLEGWDQESMGEVRDERGGIRDQGSEGWILLGLVESEFSGKNRVIDKIYFVPMGKLKTPKMYTKYCDQCTS